MPDAESWQKEQLSVAYLHAVATRFGATVTTWKPDKDGVDATLRLHGLMVDVQLKCTSSPKLVKGGYTYPLDTPTYDKLRNPVRSAPGYLVLMIAPPDVETWIRHDPEEMILSCHAYWACIQDREDAAKGNTKNILLPTEQPVDEAALQSWFLFSQTFCRGAVA